MTNTNYALFGATGAVGKALAAKLADRRSYSKGLIGMQVAAFVWTATGTVSKVGKDDGTLDALHWDRGRIRLPGRSVEHTERCLPLCETRLPCALFSTYRSRT